MFTEALSESVRNSVSAAGPTRESLLNRMVGATGISVRTSLGCWSGIGVTKVMPLILSPHFANGRGSLGTGFSDRRQDLWHRAKTKVCRSGGDSRSRWSRFDTWISHRHRREVIRTEGAGDPKSEPLRSGLDARCPRVRHRRHCPMLIASGLVKELNQCPLLWSLSDWISLGL
ncbi:MAG: hypothetical protein M2R45_02918 [Verrucomicrobia subdivision 3 bacterium]|nr:hypothetical protein [Limisphaerales bacterium]MCS1415360.1 hypothetical protein [Limisphaerales bacterium]